MRLFEAPEIIQELRSHRDEDLKIARVEFGGLFIIICRLFPSPKPAFDISNILLNKRTVRQAFSRLFVRLERRREISQNTVTICTQRGPGFARVRSKRNRPVDCLFDRRGGIHIEIEAVEV